MVSALIKKKKEYKYIFFYIYHQNIKEVIDTLLADIL